MEFRGISPMLPPSRRLLEYQRYTYAMPFGPPPLAAASPHLTYSLSSCLRCTCGTPRCAETAHRPRLRYFTQYAYLSPPSPFLLSLPFLTPAKPLSTFSPLPPELGPGRASPLPGTEVLVEQSGGSGFRPQVSFSLWLWTRARRVSSGASGMDRSSHRCGRV